MKCIKVWSDSPSESQIREAAEMIKDGKLTIIPTDSVYAIVCDALNPKAIAELCRLKGINPDKNNLSVICPDISMAAEYARIDNHGYSLLKELTPGAYTFLFKASRTLPKAFKGRKVVGIRIPDCRAARMLAQEVGNPLLTTSIKFEDEDMAREPELIAEHYGRLGVELMIEGEEGSTEYTTILDCADDASEPMVVRRGRGVFQ